MTNQRKLLPRSLFEDIPYLLTSWVRRDWNCPHVNTATLPLLLARYRWIEIRQYVAIDPKLRKLPTDLFHLKSSLLLRDFLQSRLDCTFTFFLLWASISYVTKELVHVFQLCIYRFLGALENRELESSKRAKVRVSWDDSHSKARSEYEPINPFN